VLRSCQLSAAFAALTITIALPLHAQEQAAGTDTIGEELGGREGRPIIVTAEPELETEEVRDALRDVAMRGRSYDRPLERYQTPLCVTVIGLGEKMGGQVAERVRANTREAGVAVEEGDCVPNALILVVDDQKRLIARLRDIEPRMFNARISRGIRSALARKDAAITWATYAFQGPNGAGEISGTMVTTGSDVVGSRGGNNVRTTRSVRPSKFEINFSIQKVSTVIVFDVARLDGVGLNQLGDFITMRVLGQPQPRPVIEEERAATILSLFDAAPTQAPPGLTRLDRAYLTGLYAMRPNEPGNRLEKFVRVAYENLGAQDCPEGCAQAQSETAD
jgi:hypothetical protein